jgi:hypothetical protein
MTGRVALPVYNSWFTVYGQGMRGGVLVGLI